MSHAVDNWWNNLGLFKNSQEHTLPEGQEDDTLDSAELENRIEGSEQVSCSIIEEEESVQGKGDADVVDGRNINVTTIEGPVTISIMSESLKDYDDESHDGFDQTELQSCLFAESQEADCVGFPNQAAGPIKAAGTYRFASNLWHDVAFSSQVLVAQG